MTLASLEFELPRRPVLLHKDTEMPDQSLMGYEGNPNSVVNGNTDGETLLYYAPAGTRYLDKGTVPFEEWLKVSGDAGGLWIACADGGAGGSGFWVEVVSSKSRVFRNRYLHYQGRPTNLVGVPIHKSSTLTSVMVKTATTSSGWIRIRKNGSPTNLYSVQMASQTSKIMNGLTISFSAGDSINVFVESTAGLDIPTVLLNLT